MANFKIKKYFPIKSIKNNQKGFAAFYITILVLVIVFAIAINIFILSFDQQKISINIVRSLQAYYLAESGIEDGILRLSKSMDWSNPYALDLGTGTVTVEISNIIGGVRTITSTGNNLDRVRKVRTTYQISTQNISFYYGTQAGNGGIIMGNNSQIQGNVFSNGNVVAPSGRGNISNSVIVANNGNRIEGLNVGENALAHTCKDSTIGKELTYVSGGSLQNCTAVGAIKSRPNEIEPEDLPISQEQINDWKEEAAGGGIINNNISISGLLNYLGPVQIGTPASPKNLTVNNGAQLKVTGTIYVTGDIIFINNSKIELDGNSYGSFGGVIIADGKITVNPNVILNGSGQPGSYIMILSTNSSLDPLTPPIYVANNAQGAIFYTTSGLIFLKQNMTAREITGYKVQIENNAIVQYESGLQDAIFTSGPGGSWKIEGWNEVE